MDWLRGLSRLFNDPILWVQALSLSSRKNFEGALEKIDTLERYGGKVTAEHALLKGYLQFCCGKYEESRSTFSDAMKRIEASNMVENDKQYLKSYANWYLDQSTIDTQKQYEYDFTKVTPRLKRIFKIPSAA